MASPLAGRRILVVEDELMVSWLLQDMLTDLGCTVVGPAARVDEALALIGADATSGETIDAAFLDINLDREMSYPVADVLAARGVPFVFSTGYDRATLLEGYQSCPMLQKPYHQGALTLALTSLLAEAQTALPGAG